MIQTLTKPFTAFSGWLFAKGAPEALGLMRILFAGLATLVVIYQLPFLKDYFTEEGVLPVATLRLWQWKGWTPAIIDHWPLAWIQVFCVAIIVAGVFATVGLFTTPSLFVLAFGLTALHNRNPLILNSGDTLLKINIFYLLLSQCGAAFSVDAYRRRLRGKPAITQVELWPQRVMQIQIAILYFTATWFKFQGELWREGLVTWVIFRLEELRRFEPPAFMLSELVSLISTWGTLLVELSLCTLIWFKPYRSLVILSGVALHVGISMFLNIPFFSWITMSCYVSFYSGEEIRGAFNRLRRHRVNEVSEEKTDISMGHNHSDNRLGEPVRVNE